MVCVSVTSVHTMISSAICRIAKKHCRCVCFPFIRQVASLISICQTANLSLSHFRSNDHGRPLIWKVGDQIRVAEGAEDRDAGGAEDRDAGGVDGVGNWEGYSPPSRLGDLGSVVSSPSGVRGGAPAENHFSVFWACLVASRCMFASC